ncbi:hypothetical protein [Pseudohongiella acticola]|uniref:hypothetical protein n=1 Tax=Pseudohongiella acticola TaxID=1524254 RepID=UPI0030EDCE40
MSKQRKQNKQPQVRMHSLELKGKDMERPVTAGVHFVTADGLAHGVGSATVNSEPFESATAGVQLDEPNTDRTLVEDIADVIGALDRSDDDNWTQAGPPKVAVVEAALGFQITEADRDQAWQLFNERG